MIRQPLRNIQSGRASVPCRGWLFSLCLSAVMTLATSCSLVEEDLSDCGNDYRMDYELRLVTNMNTELQTQLSMQTDAVLSQALRQYLSGIFTDHAHDVDLSFYDTEGAMERLQHDQHIMDANQASYTLYLPKRKYQHLAAANLVDNALVSLSGDAFCPSSVLTQTVADTIATHTTGLFTARQPMDVLEGVDQTFNVRLYMANCAEALVIDPRGQDIRDIKVYATGFATQFNINDSAFVYAPKAPIVRTDQVHQAGDAQWCYCAVNFPSKEPTGSTLLAGTRSVIETTEPFIAQPGDEVLWQFRAYVTKNDGSITETVLSIRKPSRAGQLTIVKGYLTADGVVQTDDQAVGVSVTLDWNEGIEHEIPL